MRPKRKVNKTACDCMVLEMRARNSRTSQSCTVPDFRLQPLFKWELRYSAKFHSVGISGKPNGHICKGKAWTLMIGPICCP